MSKLQFIEIELNWYIAWFENESTKHKKMSRRFRYWTFFLTAAATILSGLAITSLGASPDYREELGLLMIAITSSLTVIHSLEGLRRAGELWLHERTILYQLKDIRRDLHFQSADPSTPPNPEALYGRMQACLQSSFDNWYGLVRQIPPASAAAGENGNQT